MAFLSIKRTKYRCLNPVVAKSCSTTFFVVWMCCCMTPLDFEKEIRTTESFSIKGISSFRISLGVEMYFDD